MAMLLLDVDGVINVDAAPGVDTELVSCSGAWIRVPVDVSDMIETLQNVFDIHWATLWNHKTVELEKALGIGPFPVMTCSFTAGMAALENTPWSGLRGALWYAKTPLIPAYIGNTPYAWVDDGLGDLDEVYLREAHPGLPFHLERTHPKRGLTWPIVHRLSVWARDLSC